MSGAIVVPVLYRIVRSDPPTADDFTSAMMREELPQRRDREHPAEWAGLSMFDSPDWARAVARRYPKIGGWIVTVKLDARRVVVRKTFGPGHYTVWAPPRAGLDALVTVEPV